jgi:hypothetical protein
LAAAMTSMTRKGGAKAPRPIFSMRGIVPELGQGRYIMPRGEKKLGGLGGMAAFHPIFFMPLTAHG